MEASALPAPAVTVLDVDVIAWVCPHCGNYYAASSEAHKDLTREPRSRKDDPNTQMLSVEDSLKRFGSRALCSNCLAVGRKSERRRVVLAVSIQR